MPESAAIPEPYDDAYVERHCFNADGVDVTLVEASLRMTVEGRVERLDDWSAALAELRDAYAAARGR